jgi:hypothetical protein
LQKTEQCLAADPDECMPTGAHEAVLEVDLDVVPSTALSGNGIR